MVVTAAGVLKALSKPRLPRNGNPVPQGSRILYHCGTPGCGTRTSLHLLAFSTKLMRPLCASPACVKYELKTFYCPQTLLPSTDAAQDAKKNRSATAFSCPECSTSLGIQKGFSSTSTNGGIATVKEEEETGDKEDNEEGNANAEGGDADDGGAASIEASLMAASQGGADDGRMNEDYYFACPFCAWTSLPLLHDVSPKMLVDSAFQLEMVRACVRALPCLIL